MIAAVQPEVPELFNRRLNFFYRIKARNDHSPDRQFTLSEFIAYLKSPPAEIVETIRRIRAARTKEEADLIKKGLPAFQIANCGPTRGNVVENGLIQVDVDQEANAPLTFDELKEKIGVHPSVVVMARSPRGGGVKVVLRVPEGRAEEGWQQFVLWLKEAGVVVDKSKRSSSDLFFATHDPDVMVNPQAIQIVLLDDEALSLADSPAPQVPPVEDALSSSGGAGPFLFSPEGAPTLPSDVTEAEVKAMLEVIQRCSGRPDYALWLRLANATRSLLGDEKAYGLLQAVFPEEHPGEYRAKFANPCGQIGIGTLIHIAQQFGFDLQSYRQYVLTGKLAEAASTDPDGSTEPFPVDALPPILRDTAEELELVYQVPACLPALAAIGIVGGCVGSTAEVDASAFGLTRVNLFLFLSAERGSGKSSVASQLMAPVRAFEEKRRADWREKDPERRAKISILRKKLKELEKPNGS